MTFRKASTLFTRDFMKYLLIISLLFSVSACMKDSTLLVGKTNPEYVSHWYYHNEKSEPDFYQLNLLELIISNDGQASYLQCELSNDSRGNSTTKKRYSVVFDDARVINISDGGIIIEQHWGFVHLENSLYVPSAPFIEGGTEYLYVEGYKLIRTAKKMAEGCPENHDLK
jgi:hypothetical protein